MCNDLISRDKAIFFVSDVLDRFKAPVGDKLAEAIIRQIKILPVAYDVDKVVAQLKDQDNVCTSCRHPYECNECAIGERIDIVKSGGIK